MCSDTVTFSPLFFRCKKAVKIRNLEGEKRMVLIKPVGDVTIPKSECIMSDYTAHYKGRKIEVGFSTQHKMIALFVDDVWLTGTDAQLPCPEQQEEKLADTLVKMVELAKKIIDNAVAYEQAEAERNKDVV